MSLPRIFWTIDDYEVPMDDWTFGSQVGMGYAQARGRLVASRVKGWVTTVEQGSVVKAYTEYGAQVYEGRLSQPPKIGQDGLAHLAAQGHGIGAAKYGSRLVGTVTGPGAWVPAYVPPLNWQSTSNVYGSTVVNTLLQRSFAVDNGGVNLADFAMAFYAPGMRLTRFQWTPTDGADTDIVWIVYSADGPDIWGTKRIEHVHVAATETTTVYDHEFATPGDCVIIERKDVTGAGMSGTNGILVKSPRVWGDYPLDSLYAEHAGKMAAARLGWDDQLVTIRGAVPHPALDWAGSADGMLSYLASLEDARWCVWEDRGAGPVLDFGPYRKVWEVSGTGGGARWDMDPLELYNRVTVQFLNTDNSLNFLTVNPMQDPLASRGIINEAQASIGDAQPNSDLAAGVAWRLLNRLLEPRYRGRISTARAFEAGTGREAVYEVRAGDCVRITDFSTDSALKLRIHEVECSPSGITIGVEAPAIPTGDLGGGGGGGSASGPALSSTTGGVATYLPPGSSGGKAPLGYGGRSLGLMNGGNPGRLVNPGGKGW